MPETGQNTRLYVFVLVLNLVFPVFSYSLSSFPAGEIEEYTANLDPESLESAGILLTDAESFVLTFTGAYQYTNITGQNDIRFRWMNNAGYPVANSDGIRFQREGMGVLGWFFPYNIFIKSPISNYERNYLANETIVNDWDPSYNWSRFSMSSGELIFITPNNPASNITVAVYTDASINMTIAESFSETSNFNFGRFVNWYISLLTGSQSWGLPAVFSWVIRILSALSIFAVVMLSKELISL